MKNITKKLIASGASLAMVLTLSGTISALTAANNNTENTQSNTDTSSQTQTSDGIYKDETVYVIAGADGSVDKVIVSDWLKNTLNKAQIEDETQLDGIENVKGDESYTINPDNMKVWDAQGSDIYYQGSVEKSLPVDLSVAYSLDGNSISPDDLAGKSGRVSMHFTYKNNQKQSVEIDGSDEEIYVPFLMLTGMMLDNEKFTDISVSNGKVLSDGDRSIVVGYALPGLQDDLDISKDDIDIPDDVTVSADVTDFSLTTTLTLATNDLFNEVDLDDTSTVDELTGSLSELESATDKLVDGSAQLYSGMSQLMTKTGDIIDGINKLYDGSNQLASKTGTLADGAEQLETGLTKLYGGLGMLTANNQKLTSGAKVICDTVYATANTQLSAQLAEFGVSDVPALTAENYSQVLDGLLEKLGHDAVYAQAYSTALSTVTATVEANQAAVQAGVEQAVKAQVLEGVLKAAGLEMNAAQYADAVAAQIIPADKQALINGGVEQQMASDEIKATVAAAVSQQKQSLIDDSMKSDAVLSQINSAVEKADAGAASLTALKEQLSQLNDFYNGIVNYTSGVSSAADGTKQLIDGAGQIADGTKAVDGAVQQINDGLAMFKSQGGALSSGVSQLYDGSVQLSEGMQKFKDEGISKLVEASGDVQKAVTRLRAIADVSKNYKSFAGISDEMQGSVKFIYRTGSIGE